MVSEIRNFGSDPNFHSPSLVSSLVVSTHGYLHFATNLECLHIEAFTFIHYTPLKIETNTNSHSN